VISSITRSPDIIRWMYGGAAFFALIACYALTQDFLWIFLTPLVLLVVLVGMHRLDLLMFFTVIITPFSINLAKTGLGIGVSLPSEPIIFGVMLLFLFKIFMDSSLDKKLWMHPVSLAIIFHLVWMTVTTLTSSMVLVSFKATLARFCFVMVFFYLCAMVFQNIRHIRSFYWCYLIPLLGVIGYTTFNHASAGFTERAAHKAMVPFYNDHTAYAAVIAMFIPLTLGFITDKKSSVLVRTVSLFVAVILVIAIVLSYTRASWVSLVAALICYLVFTLRIKTSLIIGGAFAFLILVGVNWTRITMTLEQTEKQSSTDYAAHVQSISNITTDASNVERLNRWQSAFRMFYERPWFGWGPGTYMFQYAPFQKWSERTIISTNFGEGGNAHSEYIGPLSEQGFMGSLAFIIIGIAAIYRGSRVIIQTRDKNVRMLAKGLLLGLVTYWVHGMLNNFLDTEKASIPFWGFMAGLVALEIYHLEKSDQKSATLQTDA
jgi:putative inorganic carbon (hco3(-)) transporter